MSAASVGFGPRKKDPYTLYHPPVRARAICAVNAEKYRDGVRTPRVRLSQLPAPPREHYNRH